MHVFQVLFNVTEKLFLHTSPAHFKVIPRYDGVFIYLHCFLIGDCCHMKAIFVFFTLFFNDSHFLHSSPEFS